MVNCSTALNHLLMFIISLFRWCRAAFLYDTKRLIHSLFCRLGHVMAAPSKVYSKYQFVVAQKSIRTSQLSDCCMCCAAWQTSSKYTSSDSYGCVLCFTALLYQSWYFSCLENIPTKKKRHNQFDKHELIYFIIVYKNRKHRSKHTYESNKWKLAINCGQTHGLDWSLW